MMHSPHVLITRPAGQHEHLAQACSALGFQVSHLPCLAIEGLENKSLHRECIAQTDSVLFTSLNAVEYAHGQLPMPWPGVVARAIGPATANALVSKGQALISEPCAPFTSDAFLAQMESHPPERLIIVKGLGGRTLISDHLSELGWHVQTLDVYRRLLPDISPAYVDEIFQSSVPDIVCLSSNESLNNLMMLIGDHRTELLDIQLLVNSDRCANLADSLGFRHPALVAQSAGDQGQLSQLKQWLQNRSGEQAG